MKDRDPIRYLISVLLYGSFLLYGSAFGADKVRLQLRWFHQFQFAGYYMALEKGFYQKEGLEVELLEGGNYYQKDHVDAMLSGNSEFFIHNSSAIVDRANGKPIVALAAITQTSPFALVALSKSNINTPSDLIGKKFPLVSPKSLYAEVFAMLQGEGLNAEELTFQPTDNVLEDFLGGKLDVMDAYVTNEPFLLNSRGIDYRVISPYKYGTNFYNDVLVTSERFARDRPEATEAFVRASIKGWDYALAHMDETVALIHRRYAPDKSLEHLNFEATELRKLINPELVKVGHMNPERWRSIGETYAKLGMMQPDFDLSQFLHDPVRTPKDLTTLYQVLVLVLTLLAVASAIAIHIHRLNKRLKVVLADRLNTNDALVLAKDAADMAIASKSRVLAAASHDLRQPTHAINLFVDSLSRTELNGEQKHITHYLKESTRSLNDILDVLLEVFRLDAGGITPKTEAVLVNDLFSKIDAEFSALAANKSLRFKIFSPYGDMAISTDAKLLLSLLGNLISNAIKYTEHGGLLIAIRRRGTQALIQVWDTGSGVAPEHINNIFEEYFQVENPERDRTKGLGLGLAIAQRVAGLLGTVVICRSRPGKGSVFEFRLPLAAAGAHPPSDQSDSPKAATAAALPVRHVVLVEDDLMGGTATKLALESYGMTVSSYGTAEQALADPDIAAADFFIADLRLPGMDGLQFLDAVQQRTTRRIQAVVVTGDTAIDRMEILRSTSRKVLFKPVNLASLLAAIGSQESLS